MTAKLSEGWKCPECELLANDEHHEEVDIGVGVQSSSSSLRCPNGHVWNENCEECGCRKVPGTGWCGCG